MDNGAANTTDGGTSKRVAFAGLLCAAAVCIAGAALGGPLAGPAIVAVAAAAISFRTRATTRRLALATLVALVGTGFETALITAGLYLPRGTLEGSVLCPLWEIAIWFALGMSAPAFVPHDWRGYLPLAVGGALLAPLFYLAADSIPGAAIHLNRPLWPTLILLALLWQGLWPGICWLANRRWYRLRTGD